MNTLGASFDNKLLTLFFISFESSFCRISNWLVKKVTHSHCIFQSRAGARHRKMSIEWVGHWSEASVPLLVGGGVDLNGVPIYVGRALHEESLIPGTLRLTTKNVCVRWVGSKISVSGKQKTQQRLDRPPTESVLVWFP